ncbi:MAG: hypothetical protein RL095_3266 [Verrucomicrobiota bacterium]|jgi:molecular chaperone HtpG
MPHRFQVDLAGVISVLSEHLYTRPDVFIRELIQNGVDAVSARRRGGDLAPDGAITVELLDGPCLLFEDNGGGLTEDEVHQFLATIGQSSKRGDFTSLRDSFIGRFGIGLLSAFMVCDEIVLLTRSRRPGSPSLEWKGRADGSYSLRRLESEQAFGTRLFIRGRAAAAHLFTAEAVRASLLYYARFLPLPVNFVHQEGSECLSSTPPWRQTAAVADRAEAARRLGAEFYGEGIIAQREIHTDSLRGWAYLVPRGSLGVRDQARVYLRGMMLGEQIPHLLPQWACFVAVILESDLLTPAASRESLHRDRSFDVAKDELARQLRAWLARLPEEEPEVFFRLVDQHNTLVKSIAAQDDEFCRLMLPHLSFETNFGRLSLKELQARCGRIHFTTDDDEFRKVAPIATAIGLGVVDAAFSYEPALLHRATLLPELKLQELKVDSLLASIHPPSAAEEGEFAAFLSLAASTLRPMSSAARLARFEPADIPVLLLEDADARARRLFRHSAENSTELFADLLSGFIEDDDQPSSTLVFNIAHPVTRRLAQHPDPEIAADLIRLLQVQSLLLGRQPVGPKELAILSHSLRLFLDLALR